jgi:hypothetical protein
MHPIRTTVRLLILGGIVFDVSVVGWASLTTYPNVGLRKTRRAARSCHHHCRLGVDIVHHSQLPSKLTPHIECTNTT